MWAHLKEDVTTYSISYVVPTDKFGHVAVSVVSPNVLRFCGGAAEATASLK
jgi:hypothetical protein